MLPSNLKKKSIWPLLIMLAMLIVACTPDSGSSGNIPVDRDDADNPTAEPQTPPDEIIVDQPGTVRDEITMYVEANRYPCPNDETQRCLRVREQGGEWNVIDIPIEGFEYEEGIEYVLKVLKIRGMNQPADFPELQYELIEIVSMAEVETAEMENLDFLLNTNWDLVTMNGETPVAGRPPTLAFDGKTVNGTTGCNSYSGPFTLNGTELSIEFLSQTEMACEEPLNQQERTYLTMLMSAVSLTLEDETLGNETLTIHTEEGDLVYQPASHQALEGTAWNLIGIAAGDAMVNTWVDEQITAEFLDGRLTGNAGCNSYGTTYETSGSNITLGEIETTLMACEDEEVMARENEFLAALANVAAYEIVRNNLTLFDAGGNVVMTFVAYV